MLENKMGNEKIQLLLMLWLTRKRFIGFLKERPIFGEYHHLIGNVLSEDEKCVPYIRMKQSSSKSLWKLLDLFAFTV